MYKIRYLDIELVWYLESSASTKKKKKKKSGRNLMLSFRNIRTTKN